MDNIRFWIFTTAPPGRKKDKIAIKPKEWAGAMGGCARYIYTEVHRLGKLSVNHKCNCYVNNPYM